MKRFQLGHELALFRFTVNRESGLQYLPERVFTQTSLAVEVAGAGFVSRTLGLGGLLATYFR